MIEYLAARSGFLIVFTSLIGVLFTDKPLIFIFFGGLFGIPLIIMYLLYKISTPGYLEHMLKNLWRYNGFSSEEDEYFSYSLTHDSRFNEYIQRETCEKALCSIPSECHNHLCLMSECKRHIFLSEKGKKRIGVKCW